MKVRLVHSLVVVALGASVATSWAQTPPAQPPGNRYAERYGRYGRPSAPGMPGAPVTPTQPGQPAQPAPPVPIPAEALRFNSVPVNGSFYFLVDTNRAMLWTKISASSASNTVNSRVAKLPATVLVTTNGVPERAPAENSPAVPRPRAEKPQPPAEAPSR